MKIIATMTAFMNSERGGGHGITQGLFYGLIFLSIESLLATMLPLSAVGVCWFVLAAANHARCLYEENIVEGWRYKPKTWDYWFDAYFRGFQSDAMSALIFIPKSFWCPWLVFTLLLGYQKKDEKPFFLSWRK